MKVVIQVIKVYEIDVPDDCDDPLDAAYDMQSTEIEATGRLMDAMTDHAELLDDVMSNARSLLDTEARLSRL